MKRFLCIISVAAALLCGCAPLRPAGAPSPAPVGTIGRPTVSAEQTAPSDTAYAPSHITSPPARTPDPEDEMLVTGTVTAVLDEAIRVISDNMGMDLEITALGKAEYAEGVSRDFMVGNYVWIITSNKLAKTLPERVAAHFVLENGTK